MIGLLLWLYRGILRILAPPDLRAEFEDQIECVFEEVLRDARLRGRRELVRVWVLEVRQLGGVARRLARSGEARAPRTWITMGEGLGNTVADLRRSLVTLARRPTYSLASALTLAVGLGLTGAVYSVARVSVLARVPVDEPDRVLIVRGVIDTPQWRGQTAMSAPELLRVAEETSSFEGLALFSLAGTATLTGEGRAHRLRVNYVSPSYFEVLRSKPALGRFFAGGRDHTDRVPEVVLAHHTWTSRFGADPEVLGKQVTISGVALEVVGVAARDHVGVRGAGALEAWIPLGFTPDFVGYSGQLDSPMSAMFWGVGRLKEGASLEEVTGETTRIHDAFARDHRIGDSRRAGLITLRQHFFGGVERPFVAVSVGALLVLLVCAFNLIALARLRARERSQELALKATLGASRFRIARAAAGEAVILASVGTVAAIGIARSVLALFDANYAHQLLTFGSVELRLGLLLAVAGATTVLFSLPSVAQALRPRTDRGARIPTGATPFRGSGTVVALETALAVLVLVPAFLTGMSLARLQGVELGYQPAGLDAVRVNLTGTGHGEYWDPARFTRSVQGRLAAIPGASIGIIGPDMMGRSVTHVRVVREGLDPADDDNVVRLQWISVTPGTLATLGIERLAGRDVSWEDQRGSPLAVVLNERAARRLWPGESPLGKSLHVSGAARPNGVVVGVVRDARHVGRASGHYVDGDAYLPFAQRPTPWVTVLFRSGSESPVTHATVADAINAVDGRAAPYGQTSMTSVLRSEESPIRLVLTLTTAYALIAVLLAVIGMASILGTAVRERRRELAIRAALGASRRLLVWSLIRGVMTAVGVGLVAGVSLTLVSVPAIAPVLFQVSATDPQVYAKVLSTVLALALAATCLPSLETLRIPPAESIREA